MTVALCEINDELREIDNMFNAFVEPVSICKEYDGKGAGIGFGEYLLYDGKIDEHDLENALNYQQEEHVVLGVLAVQEGFLSGQQLCRVLDFQRERGGLFGEIAVRLGLMNEYDVDALLKMQDETHIKIGEILVLFGAISREDMEYELKCFYEIA